jgi:hypothetical protein
MTADAMYFMASVVTDRWHMYYSGGGGGGGSKSEKCPSHPGRMSQCPTTPLFAISRGIMSALATCQLQCTGRHRPYIGFVAAAYA